MRITHVFTLVTLLTGVSFNVVAENEPTTFKRGPILYVPEEVIVDAESDSGAVVSYSATATTKRGRPLSIECSPSSGLLFPLGTTTVYCKAQGRRGRINTATFPVTVVDNADVALPLLNIPGDITAEANSGSGAIVSYDASASDSNGGAIAVECTPESGSTFSLGQTTVFCSAANSQGGEVNGSFLISVLDSTRPTLDIPTEISAEATGSNGAAVTYNVAANDSVDGNLDVSCTPASGQVFSLGQTTVNCNAADKQGNQAVESFIVSVLDLTEPVLNLPSDINVEATSANATVVNFNTTANDSVDGSITVSCSPESGSAFVLGQTSVNCSAFDREGNSAEGSFLITVRDSSSPEFNVLPNINTSATSNDGATVTFNAVANDSVDGSIVATCLPSSGSMFPVGVTTVNCNASDNQGNQEVANFTVSVSDSDAPVLSLPSNVEQEATGANGAVVNFIATASDTIDGSLNVNCIPVSGGIFAIGQTTVSCNASDSGGNQVTGSFIVTVNEYVADTGTGNDSGTGTDPDADSTSIGLSVSWITPTTRENGESLPLGDISGYEIQVLSDATGQATTITIDDPSMTQYLVSGLADGAYNVSIRTIGAQGLYSTVSSPVAVVVNLEDSVPGDSEPDRDIDNIAPVLALPSNINTEATNSGGVAVNYSVSVSDNVDQSVVANCTPATGAVFTLGENIVSCNATDAAGNTASGSFVVTVVDTVGPSISVPQNITADATDATGTTVNYNVSAFDSVDNTVAVNCLPSSGSLFNIGIHPVTCEASDSQGNTASEIFQVTVLDVSGSSTGSGGGTGTDDGALGGIIISWTIPNTREDGSALSPNELSGHEIQISGTNTNISNTITINDPYATNYTVSDLASDTYSVSIRTFDAGGLASVTSAPISVVVSAVGGSDPTADTIAPVLSLPANMSIEATSSAGSVVNFNATVSDNVDQSLLVNCSPASGSLFTLGQQMVNCNAADSAGNSVSGNFSVTVADTTMPSLSFPADITREATDSAGAAVSFTVSATDLVDSSVSLECLPSSGSYFNVGVHPVACEARDDQGNTASGGFIVTVLEAVSDSGGGSSGSGSTLPPQDTGTTGGSVVLEWISPTSRVNGEQLSASELARFEIYVVSDSAAGDAVVEISDPSATSYTLQNLAPDTYYFSISIVDNRGLQSDFSEVVTAVVQ